MRKRWIIKDMYDLDVKDVAKLVLSSASSYEQTDGYSKEVSLEIALNDYSFWYNGNSARLTELENVLYT